MTEPALVGTSHTDKGQPSAVHYRNRDLGFGGVQNQVSILSSLASNDSSDKASTAPFGTQFHNPIHLTIRIFVQRCSEKNCSCNSIPLLLVTTLSAAPQNFSHLHRVIVVVCHPISSAKTNSFSYQIFLHKSVHPDYLDHFCCSSLNCLQFIRFYFKALVLRNEWSKRPKPHASPVPLK